MRRNQASEKASAESVLSVRAECPHYGTVRTLLRALERVAAGETARAPLKKHEKSLKNVILNVFRSL